MVDTILVSDFQQFEGRGDPGSPAPDHLEARAEELVPELARFPQRRPTRAYRTIRRLLDIGLVVALAPFAMAGIAVGAAALKREQMNAPVIYAQQRTGLRCNRFPLYKLRTMVTNADELKSTLQRDNLRDGPDFKVVDDPRITRVGRWLRRTSIDELPQMWNILRGDMSLIGPRPTSLDIVAYEPWQLERFSVPPGLTGLWQVTARDSGSWDDRIALDITYARRACFRLDWWILTKTIGVVIRGEGST